MGLAPIIDPARGEPLIRKLLRELHHQLVHRFQNIARFFYSGGFHPEPAGYATWQKACVPTFDYTLRYAQRVATGMLMAMFGTWYPLIMWTGSDKATPRSLDFYPIIPQVPACIGLQLVYNYVNGSGQAYNIYTGQPDPQGEVIAGSEFYVVGVGHFGLVRCMNPDSAYKSYGVCEPAMTCGPHLGCDGNFIANQYASVASASIGCTTPF